MHRRDPRPERSALGVAGSGGRGRSLCTHEEKPGRESGGGFSVSVFEAPAGVAGLDDVAVMRQAIEHGGGHFDVTEHLGPIGEGEVGGDQERGVLVKLADEMEQQLPAGLAEWEIAEFVDDDEIVAQQLLGQASALAGSLFLLELIDEIDEVEEPCPEHGSG